MHFTLDDLDFLTAPRGRALLTRLASADLADAHTLALLTALRRDYAPNEAAAGLALARLRRKAVAKFGALADSLFFTGDALEQASSPAARRWRVHLRQDWQSVRLLDLCCGVGTDALAFAQAGAFVTGIDLDPVRVAMARLNAAACGVSDRTRFEVGDILTLDEAIVRTHDLIFFDPARRDPDQVESARVHHVEGYLPPLSTVQRFVGLPVWAKLSPGVKFDQLTAYLAPPMNGQIDFIAAEGDLKEALLRLPSPQAPPTEFQRRAVMVIQGELHSLTTDPHAVPPLLEGDPHGWLIEPDPAILRAGAVAQVANTLNGALLDSEIAYFVTDERPTLPFVRAWRIRSWMPFNVKQLRAILRAEDIGTVTVKKRGTVITPEVLIPQLKLKGKGSATLVLTRLRDQQIVLICDDILVDENNGVSPKRG